MGQWGYNMMGYNGLGTVFGLVLLLDLILLGVWLWKQIQK